MHSSGGIDATETASISHAIHKFGLYRRAARREHNTNNAEVTAN